MTLILPWNESLHQTRHATDTHVSIGAGGFQRDQRWDKTPFRHAFMRLTGHYWSHEGFSDPPILDQLDRLSGIPGTLIHGRRDLSSPAVTAWQLQQGWPGSRLIIDEGDGHGGRSMLEHWRTANDDLVTHFEPKTPPS